MASEKRKAVAETAPKKKIKIAPADRAGNESKTTKHDKPVEKKRLASGSVLLQEEKAFPRGGASVLTPLEHKQIRAQAERDVLFEQQSGQQAAAPSEDHDLFDEPRAQTKRSSKKGKADKSQQSYHKDETGVRIHGLSFKTLLPGTIVLGRVIAITNKDLALALPNNLTGFVPITSISRSLTRRIESLLDQEEDDKTSVEGYEDVDLHQLFFVGQWLRAVVTETESGTADGQSAKRHIELSIDPTLVNPRVDSEAVVANCFLQATIKSVEDHGVIADLALADISIKGFIAKKELGLAYKTSALQEGQVLLCLVTGKGSGGQVVKLLPDAARFSASSSYKQAPVLTDISNVDLLLPGAAVDVLITRSDAGGVTGQVIGMIDVTADTMHAGVGQLSAEELSSKYKIGSKVKARVIWTAPKDDGSRQIGVSLLENMLAMPPAASHTDQQTSPRQRAQAAALDQNIASSTILTNATITKVIADRGIWFDIQSDDKAKHAFAHLSQISDSRMDEVPTSSNTYKVGTKHNARVLNFNPVDGTYYVSLKESIISQPFLRLEDLKVGQLVDGKVDRLLLGSGIDGITGVLIKLANHITSLVPSIHMSDAALQHPERKFREGTAVKGRVLNVDLEKRQARITIKKSLVNESEQAIWTSYAGLTKGSEGRGTIVKLLDKGAVVQYFGEVRAFLPVSEMSDAFVAHPSKQFRLGQTVMTRVINVDAETREMLVSCKSEGILDEKTEQVWAAIQPGQIVSASITATAPDHVDVEIEGGLRGLIRAGHLLDGSASKVASMLKKLRVGQRLSEAVVLSKLDRSRQIVLSYKTSLIDAAKAGEMVQSFDTALNGRALHGFVQNITPEGVYVEFANRTVGLLSKTQISPELLQEPAFGLRKDQSIKTWIYSKDVSKGQFTLTMRESAAESAAIAGKSGFAPNQSLSNPSDASLKTESDIALDRVIKATVASVKKSQINVRLAEGIHGRVDVSEIFDSWSDIKDKKSPTQNLYKTNEVISVKVLGIRQAKGWRFLPFSHRGSGNTMVDLSAKPSRINGGSQKLLNGLSDVKEGDSCIGYVNNISDDCVWMSLSPIVRGRVALMDLHDDIGLLQDIKTNFPVGSAHKLRVKRIQADSGLLDLTARSADTLKDKLTIEMLSPGVILPGRVSKVTNHAVSVQLSEELGAAIPLAELSDDFDTANTTSYSKNEVVRVRVLKVDPLNKRIWLSLRPSLVLSSSLPVKDAHRSTSADVKAADIVRGFVRHIGDKGVLVSLSGTLDAFVRISDLSDDFIKDWQNYLQLGQLVKGRVAHVDLNTKHVALVLKASHVDKNYKPPVQLDDIKVGGVVTGNVRKVEEFGVFVDIDNTQPRLSGLAHRSEIAERRVADVRGLYNVGDKVKAKVLKVDRDARKISLGLKASYFKDVVDAEESEDEDGAEAASALGFESEDDEDDDEAGGVDVDVDDLDDEGESVAADEMDVDDEEEPSAVQGLSTTGFDWTGDNLDPHDERSERRTELVGKKSKRSKLDDNVDMTGDLDRDGPQSTSDFERQLLGQPNDSALWMQYMAFHLQLSEVQNARDIADRALRTIHIRETDEKLNIWIARLNLEVEYGDDDEVEEVFKQACQMQDSLDIHEKLASIYINAGKHPKADDIFERIVKNKSFRASPDVWLNYAAFLLSQLQQPERAHALLPRALQSMPQTEHRMLTAKFAALEFRTDAGDAERGRTIFENLVTEWPKWTTGWDMWVDIERGRIAQVTEKVRQREAAGHVRDLYERMSRVGMKKKRARFVFKRWLEFEDQYGDDSDAERVKALAKEYVEKLQAKDGEDAD